MEDERVVAFVSRDTESGGTLPKFISDCARTNKREQKLAKRLIKPLSRRPLNPSDIDSVFTEMLRPSPIVLTFFSRLASNVREQAT